MVLEHFIVLTKIFCTYTIFFFSFQSHTCVMHLSVCVLVFEWTYVISEHEYMCVHVEVWILQ